MLGTYECAYSFLWSIGYFLKVYGIRHSVGHIIPSHIIFIFVLLIMNFLFQANIASVKAYLPIYGKSVTEKALLQKRQKKILNLLTFSK